MNKITTVISDLGGVYLNRGIWLFWDFLHFQYDISIEDAKLVFLKNYKQYFSGHISEELFWTNLLTEINLKEDWRMLREKLLNLFEVNGEMRSFYKKLKDQGFKMVLLSDQSKEWWPILDEKLEISTNFDVVVISSLVGLHKPNPDIYKYALDQIRSKASECVYVDDIDYNLAPAKELGMETIFFENSGQAIEEFKKLGINI